MQHLQYLSNFKLTVSKQYILFSLYCKVELVHIMQITSKNFVFEYTLGQTAQFKFSSGQSLLKF